MSWIKRFLTDNKKRMITKDDLTQFPMDMSVSSNKGILSMNAKSAMNIDIEFIYSSGSGDTLMQFRQINSNDRSIIPDVVRAWNALLKFI